MWKFEPSFDKWLLPNHILIALFRMATIYPSTILLFFSHFPKERKMKQILYLLLWILIYALIETLNYYGWKVISHHHGWDLRWSFLFDFVMFPMLLIHQYLPLLAWLLSIGFVMFLWNVFDLTIDILQ